MNKHKNHLFFDTALYYNKFKVVQYLLDNHQDVIFSHHKSSLVAYLIHTGLYRGEKCYNKDAIKLSIYQACIDSNFDALNHIFSVDNTTIVKILPTCLITEKLYQYACDKFEMEVGLDRKLIDVVDQLQEHINGYKYFYKHLSVAGNCNSLLEFIIFVLIRHYIEKNDMPNFKVIYRIGVQFDILHNNRISIAINSIFNRDVMFLLTDAIYQRSKLTELKTRAKELRIKGYSKMKKSELILALIEDSC